MLIYFGRCEPRRDPLFVVDVLAEVRKSDPDACLYLIGDGDEAYRDSVKAAIGEKGLADWVFWQKKAPQYQMKGVYQQADFFLLPTEYEIFGMVLLEAMFFRRVVLTTPNGGADMLLRSGENGIVLEKSDPARWAEALLDAAADPAKKARMEQAAYETVIHENTWDALAGRFLKIKRQKRLPHVLCSSLSLFLIQFQSLDHDLIPREAGADVLGGEPLEHPHRIGMLEGVGDLLVEVVHIALAE